MGHRHTGYLAELFNDNGTDIDCGILELKDLVPNRQHGKDMQPRAQFDQKDNKAHFFLVYDKYQSMFHFLNRHDFDQSFRSPFGLCITTIQRLAYKSTTDIMEMHSELKAILPKKYWHHVKFDLNLLP